MKKLSKAFSFTLASLMLLSLLAACGGGGNSSTAQEPAGGESTAQPAPADDDNDNTEPTTSGDKVQLQLWHYYSTESGQIKFQEYVDEYNAMSDTAEIIVTILPFADFKTQLTVGAAASSLPDLVMIDNCDHTAYSAMGMFEDITDYVSGWDSTNSFFDEIMATCTYEGRIYGLPLESNNLQIVYNADMLEAAGVEPPTTFEELKAAAAALTNDSTYGFAISGIESEESTYQFLPFFWSAGGSTMELDSDAGRRSLGLFVDMIEAGSMPRECISWAQSELSSQFVSGNIAMEVMGPWQFTNYNSRDDVNYGVTKIPADVLQASVFGGENLAIVKDKNVDEGIKFMEWMLDYERNAEWNYAIDHFVASESTLSDPKYTDDPNWAPFVEMIPNTRARDITPQWPTISSGYQTAIQGAFSGQMSVDDALAAGQAIIDEALAG